jgi:hypothetical protein
MRLGSIAASARTLPVLITALASGGEGLARKPITMWMA